MRVIERLKTTDKTLFSFEILPPLKGKSIQSIYDGIDPLMEFNPAFVNVTYHREEFIYKKREKGFLEKIAIKKRPGTVGICAAIMNKYNIEVNCFFPNNNNWWCAPQAAITQVWNSIYTLYPITHSQTPGK